MTVKICFSCDILSTGDVTPLKKVYFKTMNKLMSYLLPGILVLIVFSLVTAFFVPVSTSSEPWYTFLTIAIWVLCIVVPCVVYFLKTPPGISYK